MLYIACMVDREQMMVELQAKIKEHQQLIEGFASQYDEAVARLEGLYREASAIEAQKLREGFDVYTIEVDLQRQAVLQVFANDETQAMAMAESYVNDVDIEGEECPADLEGMTLSELHQRVEVGNETDLHTSLKVISAVSHTPQGVQ